MKLVCEELPLAKTVQSLNKVEPGYNEVPRDFQTVKDPLKLRPPNFVTFPKIYLETF